MNQTTIDYLKQEAENESLSYEEVSTIQNAFDEIPDEVLRDERENATAYNMLEEIETHNLIKG